MKSIYKIIRLIVVFGIAIGIRYIGIANIPFTAVLLILVLCILYFIWSIFKIKNSKRKDKHYIIFLINIIAFSVSIVILYIMPTKYKFLINYILEPISIIFLITTAISVIAWSISSNKK